MSGTRLLAIVLIVAGVLGLAYGSFTYTEDTHTTQVGPIKLSIKDQKTVNVPIWAGGGLILAGVVLLVLRGKN
jgi:drug/metabolite transporter (DMT)-like permease